eukprot:TRINITY_DN135245_c1_g1_i1.p1 TRINITY_DN135245_c1_g1~~TRINITY_DN135245_c1_g1_i1.p1  ORF type:complete len:515 (+),score=41.80 TRINITY_DN135245_c1_g1_i1:74-1618(+)
MAGEIYYKFIEQMGKVALLALIAFVYAVSATIVDSYIDPKGRQIDHHVGSYVFKGPSDSLYKVDYDVEMLGGNLVINLDQTLGIKEVVCDITSIELLIKFEHSNFATQFFKVISTANKDKYVTGAKWNCGDIKEGSAMLISRVLKAELNNNEVLLHTAKGHYEELIKDGSFDLSKVEGLGEHEKTICFGANSNDQCDRAKSSIPLLSSPYMDLQCTNCFVGAKATVFLSVKISFFKLREISAGLKDISVNAAFVLDMASRGGWTGDIDKTFKIVDHATIMQFWIGPVPISLWFEIPLEVQASAFIDAKALATIGAKANWALGDAYFSWTESKGWTMKKPNPTFHWDHMLRSEANFHADSVLTIVPSITVHATRLGHFGVKLEPTLMAKAYGDVHRREVCADLSYKVLCETKAELHINIPLNLVKHDHIFGPYKLIDTGVKQIGHYCHNWQQRIIYHLKLIQDNTSQSDFLTNTRILAECDLLFSRNSSSFGKMGVFVKSAPSCALTYSTMWIFN